MYDRTQYNTDSSERVCQSYRVDDIRVTVNFSAPTQDSDYSVLTTIQKILLEAYHCV